MKIEKYKCESCGKECENHYREKGWISISSDHGAFSITIAEGEYDNNKGYYKSRWSGGKKLLDFCSIPCIVSYIDHEMGKKD